MTLEKLMNISIMKEVKPLYPIKGLELIEVDNVAVIEAPVENFPKERELILSTALTVSNNSQTMRNFINEIRALKVAGLIISLPDNNCSVLEEIKGEFEETGFPIYISPWELPFSNILESVYRELFAGGDKDALYSGIPNEEFVYQIAKAAIDLCQSKNLQNEKIDENSNAEEINKDIIKLLAVDDSIMKMAQSRLNPVLEYDRLKGMNLLNTLKVFCRTNYNVSETARIMHLHRQSLLYRIGKIEELCNISHCNHEDLFLIDICIRLLETKN